MKYKSNLKKCKKDKRDYIYRSNNNLDIPKILDYRNELLDIRDQGKQGSCYAHSVACVKEWQERKDYGVKEYFSPQFFN